jgi:hypothetical protein
MCSTFISKLTQWAWKITLFSVCHRVILSSEQDSNQHNAILCAGLFQFKRLSKYDC